MASSPTPTVKKFAVIQFPGSNCDQDCFHVMRDLFHQKVRYLWHQETNLDPEEIILIPGGFSFGDYLRCGAIARFSPIMKAVKQAVARGQLVIGICNGFQILCEAGLLPGALIRNRELHFICKHIHMRVERTDTPFTRSYSQGQVLRLPIAHGEGCYFAEPEVLKKLEANKQIIFRYCDTQGNTTQSANLNGSLLYIAGICNEAGNVLGMMPHPERACDASLGSSDGLGFFQSLLQHASSACAVPAFA